MGVELIVPLISYDVINEANDLLADTEIAMQNPVSNVPLFDGTGYSSWSLHMRTFLMQQLLWCVVTGDEPIPQAIAIAADNSNAAQSEARNERISNWYARDNQAMGTIAMRITTGLRQNILESLGPTNQTSRALWERLEADYALISSQSGTHAAFRKVISFKINPDHKPIQQIDEWIALLGEFIVAGTTPAVPARPASGTGANAVPAVAAVPAIPPVNPWICAYMLLSAIPNKWDHIAANLLQTHDRTSLTVAVVKAAIVAEIQRKNPGNTTATASAAKLSAIKGKRPPPKFQNQTKSGSSSNQQQQPQKEGSQRGGRGGRGRGRSAWRGKKGAGVHFIASAIVADTPARHAPSYATIARPLADRIDIRRAPSEWPTLGTFIHGHMPPTNTYPSASAARSLAERLQVPPRMGTLQTLEHPILSRASQTSKPGPSSSNSPKPYAQWDTAPSSDPRSQPRPETPISATSPMVTPVFTGEDLDLADCVSLGSGACTPLPYDEPRHPDVVHSAQYYDAVDFMDLCDPTHPSHTKGMNDYNDEEMSTSVSTCLTPIDNHINNCLQCRHLLSRSTINKHVLYMICTNIASIKLSHYAACTKCKGKKKVTFADENNHEHKSDACEWLMDSGASSSFTPDMSDFTEYEHFNELVTTNSVVNSVKIHGVGTVFISHGWRNKDGKINKRTTRLFPVFYMPQMTVKLLSMGDFLVNGNQTVIGTKRTLKFYSARKLQMVCTVRSEHNLYWLHTHIVSPKELVATSTVDKVDFDTMHRRFGHASNDVLRHAKSNTKGFDSIDIPDKNSICRGCAEGKMHNAPFRESKNRASQLFDKIHSDLKSMPTESYHHKRFFIHFYDDHTSYDWIVFLRSKSDALQATSDFLSMIKNQYDATIKVFQIDFGGEYESNDFKNMLKSKGIVTFHSVPYMHQQNGRAERFIRTIMDKAQANRFTACLPQSYWEFAIEHALHVYNRTPIKRLDWKTPYELINGFKPDVSHFRVFGCGAYVLIPEERRINKLSPKSELMTFIGYQDGVKGFKFMNSDNVIRLASKALFDKNMFPRCPDFENRQELTTVGEEFPTEPEPSDKKEEDSDDGFDDNWPDYNLPRAKPSFRDLTPKRESPPRPDGDDNDDDLPYSDSGRQGSPPQDEQSKGEQSRRPSPRSSRRSSSHGSSHSGSEQPEKPQKEDWEPESEDEEEEPPRDVTPPSQITSTPTSPPPIQGKTQAELD